MRIAISTEDGFVSAHFGRCPSFTILEIEDGKSVKKEMVDNPGHHPGFLPEFLKGKGVGCIVAGGMGQRAIGLFQESGIEAVVGVQGSIDDVINQILDGTLEGGESLCSPGLGKGYGMERTDAVIKGKKYTGGREKNEQ